MHFLVAFDVSNLGRMDAGVSLCGEVLPLLRVQCSASAVHYYRVPTGWRRQLIGAKSIFIKLHSLPSGVGAAGLTGSHRVHVGTLVLWSILDPQS